MLRQAQIAPDFRGRWYEAIAHGCRIWVLPVLDRVASDISFRRGVQLLAVHLWPVGTKLL
ncbi:hypothetical protein ASF60_22450 [Methylobacterium sp. Leaf113]|nr:hypothetical protein ASF60_22450 [Methylobacterium sp. Leaf113]